MDFPSTPTRRRSAIDESGSQTDAETVQPTSSDDARMKRVDDYQISSLAKDDPLEANIGSVNSGLMRVALYVEGDILQAMQSGSPNIERLPGIMPAIDVLLKLSRQVDRYAQLELRAKEARQPKPANGRRTTPDIDDPLIKFRNAQCEKNGQSEEFEV